MERNDDVVIGAKSPIRMKPSVQGQQATPEGVAIALGYDAGSRTVAMKVGTLEVAMPAEKACELASQMFRTAFLAVSGAEPEQQRMIVPAVALPAGIRKLRND